MARTHPEFVMATSGLRVPSPYVEQRGQGWWCLACNCSLDNAEHLEKKTHVNRAWYWCFVCTDRGYEQRARAPAINFDTREITPKFWSNSPMDVDSPAPAGGQWAAAAAGAAAAAAEEADAGSGLQDPAAAADAAAAAGSGGQDPAAATIAPAPGLQPMRNSPGWKYEGHSDDTEDILKEIENSRTEIAGLKEQVATLGTELEDKIEQLAGAIAGISAILNQMYPRGTAGVRTLSSSASEPHFAARAASALGNGGPYDQHRGDGQSRP